jgi:poly(3-hydroxybutyrate) depolymerase
VKLAALALLVAAVVPLATVASALTDVPRPAPLPAPGVRIWKIHYRAHDGLLRRAYVQLPSWYGARRHPPIPLIISPHGRGAGAIENVGRWGVLPAVGRFAVVSPEGQGRRLTLYSWGDPGEIDDLAKMPSIVEHALPWLRLDPRRIYAFGGSMGGQETLLLVARYPHLLAGAAAFDAPTNMAARYDAFPVLPSGAGCSASPASRSGARPPPIQAVMRFAARSTTHDESPSPASRCRSGGARAAGSWSTRQKNPAASTARSSG